MVNNFGNLVSAINEPAVREVLPEVPAAPDPEMVGIDVIPIGPSPDVCDGVVVRLIRGEGTGEEVSLMAGLSAPQCREIARQLLTAADAASRSVERTLLCVTESEMWKLPGQALIVRYAPDLNFEFAVKPRQDKRLSKPQIRALQKVQRRLILP